ncbi:hypothetical protein AC519_2174 [Pseudomonas savastanoi]|nr:hypothetical protein AC519_2174 [Pseudomonas savastanoi]
MANLTGRYVGNLASAFDIPARVSIGSVESQMASMRTTRDAPINLPRSGGKP